LSNRALLKSFLPAQRVEELISSTSIAEDTITLEAEAQLKRCGGEVRLLLEGTDRNTSRPVPSLVRAVARANDWVERILRGDVANQRALAKDTGFDERYISRIIPLAFLAPDITEAILDGKQTPDLSLEKCAVEVSLEWTVQRAALIPKHWRP
jgi:hypothetical protein